MDFPKFETKTQTNFKKTEYLKTTPGYHVIRLLPPIHGTRTHWLNRSQVECLGEECPVCERNKKIILDNPSNYRDVPGYSYARQVYLVNVLDRTPAKVCPNCQMENKPDAAGNFSAMCVGCGTLITQVEVKPLNKVKVLSKGKQFFEQLSLIQQTRRDENGEIIGIENYDIELLVGQDRRSIPSARLDRNDKVEVNEDELFDLEKATVRLNRDEMVDWMKGVSLRDIFAARSAEKEVTPQSSGVTEELAKEVEQKVGNLFG